MSFSFGRRSRERELDAEIASHLEMAIQDRMARGESRTEAERSVRKEFGDVGRVKETTRRMWGGAWFEQTLQDVRYALRFLTRSKVFTMVAVLTLALGIGANTAIFSVMDAVLIRQLNFPDPDRLVSVWEVTPEGMARNTASAGNFLKWRDDTTSFDALGAWTATPPALFEDSSGELIRLTGQRWSPELFAALGTPVQLGRSFAPEEGVAGNDAVAVLSHAIWQNSFGADPRIVGSDIHLDGARYTVIGVMPEGFGQSLQSGVGGPADAADFWLPLSFTVSDRQSHRSHNYRVVGRLADGVSLAQAQDEMNRLAARIAQEFPENMTGWGVNVQPYRADLVASTRPLLMVLFGVSAAVLLLACANLANLLLSRAISRQREVALRGALGAGKSRILRQFLTEAAVLAILGSSLGIVGITLGMDLLLSFAPNDIPLLEGVQIDFRVLSFSLLATILATALFGLLPAMRATQTDFQTALRGGDGRTVGDRYGRLRSSLLVAEVALAVTLLIGAGLLTRTFIVLQNQNYGFDRENLMTAGITLPSARYAGGPDEYMAFYQRLFDRVESLPGVVGVAGSTDLPAGFGSMTYSFAIQGRPTPGPNPRESPEPLRIVTPGYFQTLGVPLQAGRTFSQTDDIDSPAVIVINDALRRLHWPAENPVGEKISFEGPQGPWMEIVGVVGDTRHYQIDQEPSPAMYMPFAQIPREWNWVRWLNVIARTEADPMVIAPLFRTELATLDPQILPDRIARLTDLYAESDSQRRFAMGLMIAFAAVALVLGIVGIQGMLAFNIARRTKEFGIRLALGAKRSLLAWAVVREGVLLVSSGLLIGLAVSFFLSRYLETLIYGIAVRDAATFLSVPVVLLGAAALAAFLPVRRVVHSDPLVGLRAE